MVFTAYNNMVSATEAGEEAAEKVTFIANKVILAGYCLVGGLALYGSMSILRNWIV